MPLQTKTNNGAIIVLFFLFFLIPFATSFLLDIQFIKDNIVRQLIIYLFIVSEIIIIGYLFLKQFNKKKCKNYGFKQKFRS